MSLITAKGVDTVSFHGSQNDLYQMIAEYLESGKHADIFDRWSIFQIDAIWDALHYLKEKNWTL